MSNNTTEKKAVVFDLDGTLLYTLEDLKNATNYALKTNDMPERTLDEVRRFVGNGVRLLMERAVPQGADNPKFEKTFSDFKEYYEAHCNDNTAPYDGIMELLKELKSNGIKLAIVSNKLDPAVKELNQLYFKEYMTSAVGEMEEEGIRKKPAPDMVQKALKELQVSAEEAIYVGDSDVGKDVNFGCGCVTVNYDGRNKSRTTVKDGAFIGCNTNLVAPVTVGENAFTAAGSTITEDVPDNSLALARTRQTVKKDWVNVKKPYKRQHIK